MTSIRDYLRLKAVIRYVNTGKQGDEETTIVAVQGVCFRDTRHWAAVVETQEVRLPVRTYGVIAVGAALGANCRFLITNWAAGRWGTEFPYGTFMINVSGSFVIGFLATILTQRSVTDPTWRLLLITGFLGAYTTFSAFTYDSLTLITTGAVFRSLANMMGSVIVGMVAVAMGVLMGRLLAG